MSNVQTKRENAKHNSKPQSKNNSNVIFFAAAIVAVVVVLIYLPDVLAKTGVSFLSSESGLNKLMSVLAAAVIGWVCVCPSASYKDFMTLAKGARTEWRKTVKPDRDTVTKTTVMVLALVVVFALMILILDWVFGSVLRNFVN